MADEGCSNEAIRQSQHSTYLPACRAYERVTPAYKGYTDLATSTGLVEAWSAPSGDGVLFHSSAAFSGAGSAFGSDYVATRTGSGWETKSATPSDPAQDTLYGLGPVTEDLSATSMYTMQGDIWNPPHVPLTFGVGPVGGPYTALATVAPGFYGQDQLVGADAALHHVFFQIKGAETLSPPATGLIAGRALYESFDGQLRLVSVKADGSEMECGAVLGNSRDTTFRAEINTVSTDGSKAFFLSPDPNAQWEDASCAIPPRLYVRVNGETTVEASAPQGITDPSGPYAVSFAGAPKDGSAVYFLTRERLLPEVVGNEMHLYRYDVRTGELTHISGGPDGSAGGAAGISVVSDDGSTVYFSSHSQLVPGKGVAGGANIYRYDVADNSYHYVITISGPDESLITGGGAQPQPNADQQIYTTPDGRFFEFASEGELTPASPPASGIRQLYLYSAASGELECLSCPPPGVTATGHPQFVSLPATNRFTTPITDDGSRALFDTPDPLVPADSNQVRDVYEWHQGSVRLISSGTDDEDSRTIGFSTDGKNAIFSTHDALLPQDRDNWTDIYDARVGGGFPEPQPLAPCSGEDCQAASGAAPASADPTSSTYSGKGNVRMHGRHRLALKAISPRQRERLARTGHLVITVRTVGSGRLVATLKARVGALVTVDRRVRRVSGGGQTHLRLSLSPNAMRELRQQGRLRVKLTVLFAGIKRTDAINLMLGGRNG